MGAARVLLLGLGRLHRAQGGAVPGELVVGPRPERELAVLQVQDRPNGAVQKAAVVADDDHRMGIFREIALQPERAFEVEVVRRLVEQQ